VEVLGAIVLVVLMAALLVAPKSLGDFFNAMFSRAAKTVVDVFIVGPVGIFIVGSMLLGRVLERLGVTDALIRLFVPIMARLRINPAVVVPGIYNIFADIVVASRIGGAVVKKAGATKDEQKIAVATMVQSEQGFATFVLGLMALIAAGVNPFPVVILAVFAPLVFVPVLLRATIYRNTKAVRLTELPRFTPSQPALATFFGGAIEGAELLFLLVIPTAAAVEVVIGGLDFLGVWAPIERGLGAVLGWLSIEVKAGLFGILAAPSAAAGMLLEAAPQLRPALVVGTFVLLASGLPISILFGQLPPVWRQVSDLSEREALEASLVGMAIRVIWAAALGYLLTPLLVR
jgi:hypothetical protein